MQTEKAGDKCEQSACENLEVEKQRANAAEGRMWVATGVHPGNQRAGKIAKEEVGSQ